MRRLHERGSSSRGVAVDAEGATLGPDCVLVRRTDDGYRCAAPDEAGAIQALLIGRSDDPDWLFRQCCRIAKALADRDVALAQIYGIGIPVAELDSRQLAKLASTARLIKANFNPDQPRDTHGRWTDEGEGASASVLLPLAAPATGSRPSNSVPKPGHAGPAEVQFAADNRRENKMVRDIVVRLRLTPEQQEKLHREISGQGLTYQEVLREARDMFNK